MQPAQARETVKLTEGTLTGMTFIEWCHYLLKQVTSLAGENSTPLEFSFLASRLFPDTDADNDTTAPTTAVSLAGEPSYLYQYQYQKNKKQLLVKGLAELVKVGFLDTNGKAIDDGTEIWLMLPGKAFVAGGCDYREDYQAALSAVKLTNDQKRLLLAKTAVTRLMALTTLTYAVEPYIWMLRLRKLKARLRLVSNGLGMLMLSIL